MSGAGVIHDTFVIERDYAATPERVFAAFADPTVKRAWFAEGGGHEVEAFEMDFRIGGVETARYRFTADSPFAGTALSSDGTFLDIQPAKRIVTASTMAMAGRIFSASLVTITLEPAGAATRLTCTHQGAFFEGADGPDLRKDGWRLLLDRLGQALSTSAT